MAKVKAYRVGSSDEPAFASDFDVQQKAVLQVTDIKSNHNKYYAIELHRASGEKPAGSASFRVFTHYGRTDDLENNPDAGAKETRHFELEHEAVACYQQIYREKTAASKGYKEVSLASSKIGSHKARGASSGQIDAKTLERIEGEKEKRAQRPPSSVSAGVQSLVNLLYQEATTALTTTVAAKITANGIETPLGVLTLGQIEKGESILTELYNTFQNEKKNNQSTLEQLSGEFYTCIPHRVGRTREAIAASVINNLEQFEQKQETLQLMKDMLQVNGDSGNVLFNDEIDEKYNALNCAIEILPPGSERFQQLSDYVLQSQIKSKSIKIRNIFSLRREQEWQSFNSAIGNQRDLFHGSRVKNWVGLLSRGILMPKIVVSMGVNRTDAGWLGNGIYFGDAACTASFYTTPGKSGSRFMAIARVALGKMAPYKKITYGLERPPEGFDSCHGVRHKLLAPSQFADDEYVVYDQRQQRMEYLVEFTA